MIIFGVDFACDEIVQFDQYCSTSVLDKDILCEYSSTWPDLDVYLMPVIADSLGEIVSGVRSSSYNLCNFGLYRRHVYGMSQDKVYVMTCYDFDLVDFWTQITTDYFD